MTRFLRTTVVCCVAAAACATGPAAAMAAAPGDNCAEPGETIRSVPWAQQLLDPQRIWPFTRGGGVIVAVLDSGVDAGHPQLSGRVAAGFDATAGSGTADSDCLGTGTQVAGVIAARQTSSVGFFGMAPGVTIVPVRVVADQGSGGAVAESAVLARGVNAAVDRGADVIAVSAVTYTDSQLLRDAVANAQTRGAIVVAAVGDLGDENDGNPTPYPAGYPGVVGVGAIEESGVRWSGSQHGDYVDLVAPGAEVVTAQPGRGLTTVTGTGVACGFVAAVAALVRAKRGAETPASEIRELLYATAIRGAGGNSYGHGVVNPYSAVNDQVAKSSPAPLPGLARPASGRSSGWDRSRDLAVTGAIVAGVALLLVLVVAVTLPRGRRRFWRSALAPAPPQTEEVDEPGPPVLLFDDRT